MLVSMNQLKWQGRKRLLPYHAQGNDPNHPPIIVIIEEGRKRLLPYHAQGRLPPHAVGRSN